MHFQAERTGQLTYLVIGDISPHSTNLILHDMKNLIEISQVSGLGEEEKI